MKTEIAQAPELIINVTTRELTEALARFQVETYWENQPHETSNEYFASRLNLLRSERDDYITDFFQSTRFKSLFLDIDLTNQYIRIIVTKTDGTVTTVRHEKLNLN